LSFFSLSETGRIRTSRRANRGDGPGRPAPRNADRIKSMSIPNQLGLSVVQPGGLPQFQHFVALVQVISHNVVASTDSPGGRRLNPKPASNVLRLRRVRPGPPVEKQTDSRSQSSGSDIRVGRPGLFRDRNPSALPPQWLGCESISPGLNMASRHSYRHLERTLHCEARETHRRTREAVVPPALSLIGPSVDLHGSRTP